MGGATAKSGADFLIFAPGESIFCALSSGKMVDSFTVGVGVTFLEVSGDVIICGILFIVAVVAGIVVVEFAVEIVGVGVGVVVEFVKLLIVGTFVVVVVLFIVGAERETALVGIAVLPAVVVIVVVTLGWLFVDKSVGGF